jgi:polar amino acid transport system permease protein
MTYQPSALQLQREAAKRRASRRSTVIALGSTLTLGLLLVILITGAQGYEMVKNSFFNWHYAKQAMPSIFHGLLLNLRVLLIAEFFVLLLGLLIAIARTTTSPVLYPISTCCHYLYRSLSRTPAPFGTSVSWPWHPRPPH